VPLTPLPFRASLKEYLRQAEEVLAAWRAGDPGAVQIVRQKHPRFLGTQIPWLPKQLSDAELRSATLELSDAQLTIARWYDFESWPRLAEYVEAVTRDGSAVSAWTSAQRSKVAAPASGPRP